VGTKCEWLAAPAGRPDGWEALGLLERSLTIVDSLGVGHEVGARLQELIDLLQEKLGAGGQPGRA
jgi:hypothetical protein